MEKGRNVHPWKNCLSSSVFLFNFLCFSIEPFVLKKKCLCSSSVFRLNSLLYLSPTFLFVFQLNSLSCLSPTFSVFQSNCLFFFLLIFLQYDSQDNHLNPNHGASIAYLHKSTRLSSRKKELIAYINHHNLYNQTKQAQQSSRQL